MMRVFASKRFSIYLVTLLVVTVLGVLGTAPEVVQPLATGLGGALLVLLGGESWVDVARSRATRARGTAEPIPVDPPAWAEPVELPDLPDPVVPPQLTRPRRTPS